MATAFDEYAGYAHQRAAVAEGGSGWESQYEGTLAVGFVIADGAVDPDEVRSALLEAIRPADVVVEDRRVEHDWGASGPILFDLLIGMAGSMSASAVVAAVGGLLHRARRSEEAPEHRPTVTADEVSRTFAEFVSSALRGRDPKIDEISMRDGYWYVSGRCSRGRMEGLADASGEIVIARLVQEGQDPLVWPL